MKISKHLELDLTNKQILVIKKWLKEHRIESNGKKSFALIAEPKINNKYLYIKLLTIREWDKLDRFFSDLQLYNE